MRPQRPDVTSVTAAFAGIITALPPRTTAASWKKLPTHQRKPARLPGRARACQWKRDSGWPCRRSMAQRPRTLRELTASAPVPKDAIHEPQLLKRSCTSNGQLGTWPAQPLVRWAYRLPMFTTPNCTADRNPASIAAASPAAKRKWSSRPFLSLSAMAAVRLSSTIPVPASGLPWSPYFFRRVSSSSAPGCGLLQAVGAEIKATMPATMHATYTGAR
mmetsp:Transcript_26029/g.82247  ORF Transcript_26029/g.82247 Transcript_26029/m.82247 type:complete len:217 (-) Transcript_26029:686-1336(-)